MQSKIVKDDFKGLQKFLKACGDDRKVRVGIFGNKTSRDHSPAKTNAEIGAIHEFGNDRVPRRSFLRMPLHKKSDAIVKAVTRLHETMAEKGDKRDILKLLGFKCEAIIEEAFDSGGFGEWKPLAPSTVKRKGSDAILIEFGELRRAIASEVVE